MKPLFTHKEREPDGTFKLRRVTNSALNMSWNMSLDYHRACHSFARKFVALVSLKVPSGGQKTLLCRRRQLSSSHLRNFLWQSPIVKRDWFPPRPLSLLLGLPRFSP